MPQLLYQTDISFPDLHHADEEGLLAIGGDLSEERLLLAYRSGIFPWFNQYDPILWWSPDPRFVLLPDELKISKSMRSVLNGNKFRFTINKAFEDVIHGCKTSPRGDGYGTWITDDIEEAYINLHYKGHAHSAEAWYGDELVGGLYGVRVGKVFCGESMFTKQSNASKFAFIKYVHHLQLAGVKIIDCQVYTEHLQSLGGRFMPRSKYLEYLQF
jgi:leucyl/phenylalanyl-tRNA---protein transferase